MGVLFLYDTQFEQQPAPGLSDYIIFRSLQGSVLIMIKTSKGTTLGGLFLFGEGTNLIFIYIPLVFTTKALLTTHFLHRLAKKIRWNKRYAFVPFQYKHFVVFVHIILFSWNVNVFV